VNSQRGSTDVSKTDAVAEIKMFLRNIGWVEYSGKGENSVPCERRVPWFAPAAEYSMESIAWYADTMNCGFVFFRHDFLNY
jgi:hypothetical protein